MLNVDAMGLFYWRHVHLDVGLHCGSFTESDPPFDLDGPLRQYLSLGCTLPICNRWAFDLNFRRSYNITFKPNTYGDILEGFVGVQYMLTG